MRAGRRTGWAAHHERAEPGPGFDETLALQVAVGLEDGVGIDRGGRDDLPHRGELVADVEHAHPERLADLLDDLQVRGHYRAAVQPEADHRSNPPLKYYGVKTLDAMRNRCQRADL